MLLLFRNLPSDPQISAAEFMRSVEIKRSTSEIETSFPDLVRDPLRSFPDS